MALQPEQSKQYIEAVNQKYAGIALTDELKESIVSDMAKSGVAYEDAARWVESRPSFRAGEGSRGLETGPGAEAREAGFFESISLNRKGPEAVNKAAEQGVFSKPTSQLVYEYGVEPLANAAQIAMSFAFPPAGAASKVPATAEIGLSALSPFLKSATAQAATGLTVDIAKESYRKSILGDTESRQNEIEANVFDNFASGMLPAIRVPYAKGSILKPVVGLAVGTIYGGSQAASSSMLRGESSAEAIPRIALTAGLSALGVSGSAASEYQLASVDMVERNAKLLKDVGMRHELGMVNPEYANAYMVKADKNIAVGEELREELNNFISRLSVKVGGNENKFSSPAEMSSALGGITGKLAEKESALKEAAANLESSRSSLSAARTSRAKAFTEKTSEVKDAAKQKLENARVQVNQFIENVYQKQTPEALRKALGRTDVDPITAYQSRLIADEQIDVAHKAFKAKANELYSLVPNGSFNAKDIRDEIESSLEMAPVDQRNAILAMFDREVGKQGEDVNEVISFNQLINLKGKLFDSIKQGPSDTADHYFSESAKALVRGVDGQAKTALGVDGLAAYDTAKEFYRNVEAFKDPSIKEVLWGKSDTAPWAVKVIKDMQDNGTQGVYSKLVRAGNLIPDPKIRETYIAKMNDALRSHLMDLSTDRVIKIANDGREIVEDVINPKKFVANIGSMVKRDEALKSLGLGDSYSIKYLDNLVNNKYPDATKLSKEELTAILKVGSMGRKPRPEVARAFQDAIDGLALQHADSKMNKAAVYEAFGMINESRKSVFEARKAYSAAKRNLGTQEESVVSLKNNPLVQILRNVNVNIDSFEKVKKTFFNPEGPLSNKDIRTFIVGLEHGIARKPATRENKMLAAALKSHFLNDIANMATSSSDPVTGLKLVANALRYNEKEASVYQRAVALFGEKTINSIRKDYEAAALLTKVVNAGMPDNSALQSASALGGAAIATATGFTPKGSSAAGIARNSVNFLARGKYALANSMYAYAPKAYIAGKEQVGVLGKAIEQFNFSQKAQFMMQNQEAYKQYQEEGFGTQKSPQ